MAEHPFVHLHFHTGYSLLDGACRIPQVMDRAQELGMTAAAITDHGVLYGVVDFFNKAHARGIKPILGCEVYMAHGSMHERKTGPGRSQSNHLVLLAENARGYHNLQYLVSKAHTEGFYYKPRIDKELLAERSEGLIGLSACLKGELAEHCAEGDTEGAMQAAGQFADIFGPGNFYVELQDHGIAEQRAANPGLVEVARRLDLPLICSNDVHYVRQDHSAAHDVMICLQTGSTINKPGRMRYGSDQFYMKSGAEMYELFRDYPEALTHTQEIAERCNVDLGLEKNELHFPKYDVPGAMSQREYLLSVAADGLRERYGIQDVKHPANEEEQRIVDRFFYELGIIETTGFVNYFLVVWDFIRFARERKIPVGPGRGSGAGSIVAYALAITNIDPLYYNLIFERFLNPERVSPPDFDIDFCQTRRGEVIEYVKEKYGRENVAQIITFGSLGAKTVIRDIGRVLEIPFGECDRIAKLVPEDPNMTLDRAMDMNPDFKRATETDEHARNIMQYAKVLEGLPRNAGTHAAGVVIGEKPLIELLPLARDKNGETITQFEMKSLDEVGLLKLDFLGLKTLTVIQEAVENVRDTSGIELNMDELPVDDKETFELLNRGDTIGVFQVESKGMRDLLRRIGLTRFEDLIAMIALFRPGPMNMLDDFVKRKHGKVKIVYDHPKLEPILEETYGVMLYQEQVQQAANVLAGFSLAQGDILRRAMGKKDPSEMASVRKRFVEGCKTTSDIPRNKAEKIFDAIAQFAGYGFNKSHSAAYAVISYQTAYLKTHHPVEFMAALLSIEMGNTDKLPGLIAEAQDMQIDVLPPDVSLSGVRFRPEGGAIRFGMAGVKNVGVAAMEALVKERDAHGPFKGLVDFCSRVDAQACNRKALESLIKCGAFDFTEMSRGRLYGGLDFAMARAASAQRDRAAGQGSLFDMLGTEPGDLEEELPGGEPWPEQMMLAAEKELIGFYISGHPLREHAWVLKTFSLADTARLDEVESGAMTRIGGLVTQFQKRFTRQTQEAMGVFRLEHMHGTAEVVVFPDSFSACGVHLVDEAPVMVCGKLLKEDGIRIQALEVYPMDEAPTHFASRVSIHLPAANLLDEHLQAIHDVLRRYPGSTRVVVCLQYPAGEKVFISTDRAFTVGPSRDLVKELESILGEDTVYVGIDRNACKKNHNGRGRRGQTAAAAAR